jgi:arylsulfatase A-like enzyme
MHGRPNSPAGVRQGPFKVTKRFNRMTDAWFAVAAISLLLAAIPAAALTRGGEAAASASPSTPNILFIVTDDQRDAGTMGVLPAVVQQFKDQGVDFTHGYVTTPGCCPSRSSIFSGRYSHNHRVTTNEEAVNVDQRFTLQRYLHDAGYLTGIYGKFLNAWTLARNPPYFDKWSIFTAGYSPVRVNEQGTVKGITQYATSYISDNAVQFIQNAESNDNKPWFLYLATTAPHAPFTPEAQYANATVPPFEPNPATFESDRSDKPPYVQSAEIDQSSVDYERTQQLRTLMSVNDLVQTVFQTLDADGETSDTLAVFVSDNGYLWGEHMLEGKGVPYIDSIKVPFMMRWPGHISPGTQDSSLAANIDLAPTALDAVGGITPLIPMDGHSLLDPLQTRERLLLEVPGIWAASITPTSHYIEYYGSSGANDGTKIVGREFYDLTADPYELDNRLEDGNEANDPSPAVAAQLDADRHCVGQSCP